MSDKPTTLGGCTGQMQEQAPLPDGIYRLDTPAPRPVGAGPMATITISIDGALLAKWIAEHAT